jgi:site-specific recombinase XerC
MHQVPPVVPAGESVSAERHVLAGHAPRNKGRRYPADPPPVEEIISVMRAAGTGPAADRARALIVILWRAGLRISEALALAERDLDPGRGAVLVRSGKGGKRREVGMDAWAWEQLRPWLQYRATDRRADLRDQVTGRRWTVGADRGTEAPAPARAPGGCTASVRSAPTPPRACG